MNKTKRVLSVVLAVLMLSSLIAALAIADGQHTVVINYVFENGKQAAPSWTATLAEGSNLEQTVTSPTVVGYEPDQATVDVTVNNITENKTYTVTYHPANVGFTVNHYLQNVADNNYTLDKTEEVGGFTESEVGDGLAETYPGFAALLYNTKAKVAADGSTVVEIKYDRNYYMMSFNLDGGYGVEPIYARFGASVKVENPTKPGYTFNGWEPTVPTTVPAENTTYKAKWQAEKTAKVTVVVWGENADDENYSYIKSVETTAPVGSTLTAIPSGTNLNMGTKLWELKRVEQTTVAADGSSVLNVYYDRKEFTLTFKYDYHSGFLGIGEGYKKTGTITAKWGADIGSRFLAMNAAAKGSLWSTNYSGAGPWTSFLQIMPEENRTYYCQETSNTAQSAYYYTEGLDGKYVLKHTVVAYSGSNLTITAEDFYPMEGFTYDHGTDGDGNPLPSNPGKAGKWSGAKFYYKRNSYDLVFISNNTEVKTSKVKFEAALGTSGGESFVPAYPSNFEPNAFEFAGWYQDPEGVKPVDWNAKMPAASVTVYAKWAPKNHTVKTFLTKEKIEENDPIDTWDNVPHGTAVTNTPADPQNGSYVFVGWFYMDGNVEKAFDFSMPVVKDLNLYAKWSSNTLVTYTIYYKSGDTEIAEPTTGSALAGTTLTFEAKTGDELNEGYQSGYFPHTGSHSLTMDINGNNEFTFVYVAKEKVGYTVRYLEKGTEKVLHEEKTAKTSNAIITEKFVQISGYAPDAYQKRLVLSATEAENVITFWYTKDDVHAPVQIVHWTQNIAGEGYTEYQSSTNLNGEIGQTYTGTPLTIPGFTYNAEKSNASGELTAEGLELNLYYDRVKYSYTVRYVDATDNNKDIDHAANVTGEGLFGAQVIGSQKEFNGYMPADNEPKQKSIIIGTGTNEIIFYYYPCYYIGHVRSGRLNNTDTIRLIDSKANLTAAVTPGYLYGGAFTDVACDADHVQTFTQGENAINFTPVKGETYYIWEVSETYLKPRAYVVSRHDPNAIPDANGSTLNVVGLYLTSSVDRNMYSEVGFTVDGTNFASDGGKVYDKVQAVYTDGSGVKEEMYVMDDGVWDVQAQAPASRGGYVSIYTVSMNTFYKKSAESSLSYQPYWVTLDGIKVTGAYEARTCYYQGVGNGDIGISNCVDSDSAVSIYRAATTNTIGVESVAVLSAAPETVQPEVPVTPEIPEVPEAPDMTLNNDAMYLRAQYTYEMMTNTVKFISAIDVNECTEYGFVINGEVVKCEEAAETVDGYDANYLFGGSVNGAMLMSCNMLLDGLVDGMTLNVTPYYVALDGTTVVYGETRTLVYRQWVGLEG
jgi:cell wall/surface repeat protein